MEVYEDVEDESVHDYVDERVVNPGDEDTEDNGSNCCSLDVDKLADTDCRKQRMKAEDC